MFKILAESPWTNQIGWLLVHSLWQFTVLATVALGLQRALARRSAATRYWALLVVLMLVITVPIATWFALPPVAKAALSQIQRVENARESQSVDTNFTGRALAVGTSVSRALPHATSSQSDSALTARVPLLSQLQRQIQPWLSQIVILWIVGVSLAALRPLISLYTMRRLRTVGVSSATDAVQKALQRTARKLGVKRAVQVLQSAIVQTPVVVGYFRPAIILPLCVMTGLNESQLELILAHELAHIRRHDFAINLLQILAETLFFYHPAVWWISSQIRNERENCCDDVAMARTGSRLEYGRALLAIEELRGAPTVLSLAAGGGSLLARIRRISGYEPVPRMMGGASLLSLVLVSTLLLAAISWADAPSEATDPPSADTAAQPTDESWKPGQVLDLQFVNAETKEPLPGVQLELQFSGKGINFQNVKVQTTDAEGRSQIHLPDREPDAVRVYPSKAGFVPLRVYWDKNTSPPLIPKTETVAMQPGAVWGGLVQNEKGDPIPGVKVTVHYWEDPNGNGNPHLRANLDHDATTDAAGRWRMDVMPQKVDTDQLRFYVAHSDYVSDEIKRAIISMPLMAQPSVESLRAETAVTTMRKGGTVTGKVVDEAGKPIGGAKIYSTENYWSKPPRAPALTGDDGTFEVKNLVFAMSGMNDPPPSTWNAVQRNEAALVILAAGHAPELIHIDPNSDSAPKISLKPGKDVKGRVVDQQGKPIEGVQVAVSNWLGYRERLNLETKTDADGRFRLPDAPANGALYGFYKEGYMGVMDFPMLPQADQQLDGSYEVTLKTPMQVSGAILDGATGKLVTRCTVTEGIEYDDGRAPEWQRYPVVNVSQGRYTAKFSDSVFAWRIRVEADGYQPAISPIFRPDESENAHVTFDFKLTKGTPITGTVLNSDDKPLANAEVYLATNPFMVEGGKPSYESRRRARFARTDATGRFELPPEVEPFALVVLDDQGSATVTDQELANNSQIQIKPWEDNKRQLRIERSPYKGPRQ